MMNVMKMRKMERVTFDVIFMLDPSASAEAKAWKELSGTWTATNKNGSYRTKIISPYLEEIKYFDASGKLNGHHKKPMSIEFKNGLKFFSAHMGLGALTPVYLRFIMDKWYEQTSERSLDSNSGST